MLYAVIVTAVAGGHMLQAIYAVITSHDRLENHAFPYVHTPYLVQVPGGLVGYPRAY